MNEFDQTISDVEEKYSKLLASPKHRMDNLPRDMPLAGIYLLSEHGKALYVGRTNNLRNRLQYHTRNKHNQATFAFLLAREKTGKTKASYQKVGSREDLLNQPDFRFAFDEARQRIKEMDVQFVEEADPIRQALLEICTAMKVRARYNDFNNH
ncbi:MAG: GIY-YIG nuclease family protein [Promethearchaeota archaeon]